jgi:hypothetical protein
MARIDPRLAADWRPDYWPALPSDDDLVNRIRGARRRKEVRAALQTGDVGDHVAGLLDEALTREEVRALMAVHPHLTLGEYLPDLEDQDMPGGEVEIARLYIASGIGNTISIRARKRRGNISYRCVDEFEEKLRCRPATSLLPLTNTELLALTKTIRWAGPLTYGNLWKLRDYEAEIDAEHAADFINGDSELYPAFAGLIADDNSAWLAAQPGADEDDDDEGDIEAIRHGLGAGR